jgi:hypothetical protein
MTFKSKLELLAVIPHIKNAPKNESFIENLCFRPERNQRSFPDFMVLTPNEGIKGDRWLESPWLKLSNGKPDPGIQVSILSTRVWDAVKFGPEAIHPGDTFMSDFDTSEENCPAGTILSAGTAMLKVSGVFNDGCVKWKVRYGVDAKKLDNLKGKHTFSITRIIMLCCVSRANSKWGLIEKVRLIKLGIF